MLLMSHSHLQSSQCVGEDILRDSAHGGRLEPTVVCTIIAKNYLAHARSLMQSVRELHPDTILAVLLVDEIDGYFDPAAEVFDVFVPSHLGIPRWKHFSMKYDIMELSTAVKPYFLELLFERYNASKVIYLDPDIIVYSRLDELLGLLDIHILVLSPHITHQLTDTFHPDEREFLRVGTFNLGFCAFSRRGEWLDVLHWWKEKLYNDCINDVERGLFVDQHWMDLAPSLFSGVHIERHPGYNVAYWNFKTRELIRDSEGYRVNGFPLIFLHFSGFSFDDPEAVSKHQDRYIMADLNEHYQQCFRDYRERLRRNGYETTRSLPYAYGIFPDGVPVADMLRDCLRGHDPSGERWPDPYDIEQPGDFRSWATSPWGKIGGVVSPYAYALYWRRPDLQEAFPGVVKGDPWGYVDWFVNSSEHDASAAFQRVYIEPIRRLHMTAKHSVPRIGLRQRATQAFAYYAQFPVSVLPYLPPRMRQIPFALRSRNGAMGALATRVNRSATRRVLRNPWLFRLAMSARQFVRAPGGERTPSVDAIIEERVDGAGTPSLVGPTDASVGGVNVIGYLRSETGVGQVARNVLRCFDHVGFPASIWPIESEDRSRKQDSAADHYPVGLNYWVNIFHVNADMTFPVRDMLGAEAYRGHYNIGYWFWEMPVLPKQWYPCLDVYDEVWVSSAYTQQAVSACSRKPVVRVPVAIDVPLPEGTRRSHLYLPDDAFIVLFVFDALSIPERKNPWAVIEAFERAFSAQERHRAVRLVVKVSNLKHVPEVARRLRSDMQRVNGVLIDEYFNRLQTNALLSHCDVYMSLHRSEGYGLTIAEAMFLGKPVIVTAYSGNMDFTTPNNSYLVPYTLVPLTQSYPPYELGNHWADADVGSAASLLRSVYENRDAAEQIGRQAAIDIRRYHSPAAVGDVLRTRLSLIAEASR